MLLQNCKLSACQNLKAETYILLNNFTIFELMELSVSGCWHNQMLSFEEHCANVKKMPTPTVLHGYVLFCAMYAHRAAHSLPGKLH